MVVVAAGAFDVEGLRDGGKAEKLILFEIFAEEVRLVPIETVFTISSLTPTAVDYSEVSMALLKETDKKYEEDKSKKHNGCKGDHCVMEGNVVATLRPRPKNALL